MQIVSISEIPKGSATPTDNLIELYKNCLEMERLCDKLEGIGLSAVQVGIPWSLFIVKANSYSKFDPYGKYGYFLNCSYDPIGEEKTTSIEGCLSIKNEFNELKTFKVDRWRRILLKGQRLEVGKEIKIKNIEIEIDTSSQSVVFQHEIDHQNGVLISDIGQEYFIW